MPRPTIQDQGIRPGIEAQAQRKLAPSCPILHLVREVLDSGLDRMTAAAQQLNGIILRTDQDIFTVIADYYVADHTGHPGHILSLLRRCQRPLDQHTLMPAAVEADAGGREGQAGHLGVVPVEQSVGHRLLVLELAPHEDLTRRVASGSHLLACTHPHTGDHVLVGALEADKVPGQIVDEIDVHSLSQDNVLKLALAHIHQGSAYSGKKLPFRLSQQVVVQERGIPTSVSGRS